MAGPVRVKFAASAAAVLTAAAVGACSLAGVGPWGAAARTDASDSGTTGSLDAVHIVKGANPVAGWQLYRDPTTNAAREAAQLKRAGKATQAALVAKIANRPVSQWITSTRSLAELQDNSKAARSRGQALVVTLYAIPHRDCGSYSAGGEGSAAAYRSLVRRTAAAIGSTKAIVVLEPDAVAMTPRCAKVRAEERYSLLASAVAELKRNSSTRVYIDAGNPNWHFNPAVLVPGLRQAGLGRADGFALNVSNFQTTDANYEYGLKLSALTGGKHFVVDTSRNGRGPQAKTRQSKTWCNPAGRGLGQPPTTRTGKRGLDAVLWVKTPGASDGNCRPGEPSAGTWWAAYAAGLAKRASW